MSDITTGSSTKRNSRPALKYLFKIFLQPTLGWWSGAINFVRQRLWRRFYQITSRVAANDTRWQYTNYGFLPDDGKLVQIEGEVDDRCGKTCIQLYHEVVSTVPVEGKNVVEIGCGRGGGAYYIDRFFKPATMTAIDLSVDSINFAIKYQKPKCTNVHFRQGNALELPLPNDAYDVVINIESSHCYPSFPKFLSEVYRVLKPGGFFVMCDMRLAENIGLIEQEMNAVGFTVKENVDITKNILESMKLCSADKEELMKEIAGELLYRLLFIFFSNFAGLVGSEMYYSFESRTTLYKRYVLQKQE